MDEAVILSTILLALGVLVGHLLLGRRWLLTRSTAERVALVLVFVAAVVLLLRSWNGLDDTSRLISALVGLVAGRWVATAIADRTRHRLGAHSGD